jgi:predicted dehydrogenase
MTTGALLVGLGSIGRRHLGLVRELLPDADISVLRHSPNAPTDEQCSRLADRVVCHFEEAVAHAPAFAIIATPAPFHVETALRLADRGVHLLLEKPLSDRLDGVQELLDVCRRRQLVLMVAYVLRHHRSVQALRSAIQSGRIGRVLGMRADAGQYLPEWRPGRDYRETPSARKQLGGGALLELSHEIDYARWLLGEVTSVQATLARLGDLDLDVEDWAELTLRFAGGAVGSIHLDMLQRSPTRTCRVLGTEGTLAWDSQDPQVRLYSAGSGQWTDLDLPAPVERNAMYRAQLQHFLACVAGRASPCASGEDGKRVLEVVLAARESAALGKTVELSG